MRNKVEWKWELIDDRTQRAKVRGGWIVMRLCATEGAKGKQIIFTEAMVFVQDQDHLWEVLKPAVDMSAPEVSARFREL
jgi:hypothetical protein